jgi:site-specific recombinase XerD
MPTVSNREPSSHDAVLSAAEVARLIGACSGQASSGLRNRAIIAVLYRAGLRVCEALELEASDVDAGERLLFVHHGERSRRVSLDSGAFRIIERWVERRSEIDLPESAPLFCTLSGTPLASSYLRALLHRLATKAGIDKHVSAEVLRRSLAFELSQEGFSVVDIQAQFGHSTAAVTSRYLARLESGDVPRALRRRQEWRP